MKKVGLVLQGGGTRIAFSTGVVDVMMENNIFLPYVIGTSGGSMIAINYVSRNPGSSIKLITGYIKDKNFLSISNFRKRGSMFNFEYLMNEEKRREDIKFNQDEFDSGRTRMLAVATECSEGKAAYFELGKCKDIIQGVTASSSLPLVSKPYKIDKKEYLDGGLTDPIPFKKAFLDGNEKVIIIATRDYNFRKSEKPKHRGFLHMMYGVHYPEAYLACLNDGIVYNRAAEDVIKLEKEGKAFVVRPEDPITISHTEKDVDKINSLYKRGRESGKKYLKQIQEFINE